MDHIMQNSSSDDIIIRKVFNDLESYYGYFVWWPSDDAYQIMLGAILVQNTNWNNAQKAIDNLGERLNPEVISAMDLDELAPLIRPSGYYNQKAIKIKALTAWYAQYRFDIALVREQQFDKLRSELLAIKGVGGETADVILTYAIGKASFVIDAYARRIFSRFGLTVPKSYESFRDMMQQTIASDTKTYAYYHGLMVEHGQRFCKKRPICEECPLFFECKKFGI